ncbi:unnamed protein product [Closterium sp. NIES-64]|nr:unnamed protein product [Closterium sp. NIES-64]
MGAAQGGLEMSIDGMTRGPTQTEGPERAEKGTEDHGTPRSDVAADGGAKETDGAEIELEAAAPPAVAAGGESGVAAAGVPAVLVSAGASAAAFGAGSVSPSATPRAAQAEAEGMRLGASPEQTAEAALSASPAPVTPAALAAAVFAATGVQGDAPTVEGATTAAANVGMPAADAASRRQGHVQAEGETPRPPNGAASGAARVTSTRKPRAQPAPRRLGAGLGPGSPGPLLGWLLQGQLPSERVHRSSSAHTQEERGVSGLNEATTEATATCVAEQPAPNQNSGPHTHSPSSPVAPTATAVATRRSARLGAVTWGPPRGGRSPWMPAGRAGLAATPQPALAAIRGFRDMDRGRRGGRRGGVARLGGAEIQARTGPWRERHDRPEVLEAPANGVDAEPAEDMGDPEFMYGEEAGPESEEVSMVNEEDLGRGRNRVRGTGEGVARATSQAKGSFTGGAAGHKWGCWSRVGLLVTGGAAGHGWGCWSQVGLLVIGGAAGYRWGCWSQVGLLVTELVPGAGVTAVVLVLVTGCASGAWCWRDGAGAGAWCWRDGAGAGVGAGDWLRCWCLVLA